jgi:CRP/FNR family transcriptional regulator, cyclic AMP receptor protein
MREPRVLKVGRDQAVERDLHQQVEVELAESPQCVARAFRSELLFPQPRDQRMKVSRGHELRHEVQRRLLLRGEIIISSDRHPTRLADRKSHPIISTLTGRGIGPLNAPGRPTNPPLQSANRQPDHTPTRPAPSVTMASLVATLPEIAGSVGAEDRLLAERALTVPLISTRDADLADVINTQMPDAFDFLIVNGIVLKETTLAGRSALELLGRGDLLAPPLTPARQLESRALSRYLAHGQVSLAAIENHVRQAARRWPGIADYLHDRLARQTHHASMHLAMLHLPRIEDRLIALFADLAERFGHMTADGVLIDVPLTHEIIGGLVGSRRPTVSLALRQLSSNGTVERIAGARWKLDRSIVPD